MPAAGLHRLRDTVVYTLIPFSNGTPTPASGNRGTHASDVVSSVPQPPPSSAESQDSLQAVVADLDARYFDAYNRCDLEALETFHADDFEAYHDRRGGPFGWEAVRGMLARGVCAVPGRLRRELVPGTLAAYRIAGVGAVQMADHVFYEKAEDGEEQLTTAAKLSVLWRRTEDGWKKLRVISYDHGPPSSDGRQ
jgi:ketosteroid isomerase-like protein